MKLHFLYLSAAIVLFSCNSNSKKVVKDSKVKVPEQYKKTQKAEEYLPKTSSISQLLSDTLSQDSGSFSGRYIVADKYLLNVQSSTSDARIKWQGFDEVLYKNESCSYDNLICFSTPNPDYGKFYMNTQTGKLIYQQVENPGDTLYYEVNRLKKLPEAISDFDGGYSIISPKQDSVKFIIKARSPFKYEYALDTGKKQLVYYRGRDQLGLMHYSNALMMNSDHLSGLYKWQDDSNGTVVKLEQ